VGSSKPLDWLLLDYEKHFQMQQYVKALNEFYTGCPALFEVDDSWHGFTWLNVDEARRSALSFMRRGDQPEDQCICAFNFTPVPVDHFVIGLPGEGQLREVFSSDDKRFGGRGLHQTVAIQASKERFAGHPCRAVMDLPPLTALYFNYTPLESDKE
jgi:1,4-alpha-glucan branching enzyme